MIGVPERAARPAPPAAGGEDGVQVVLGENGVDSTCPAQQPVPGHVGLVAGAVGLDVHLVGDVEAGLT